jgi:hypothetical protein
VFPEKGPSSKIPWSAANAQLEEVGEMEKMQYLELRRFAYVVFEITPVTFRE